jgi:hypothetical protein|tara:strand:- start:329 stop:568 length:240 start_codon:yes stop_codon:yes gene_type:complete
MLEWLPYIIGLLGLLVFAWAPIFNWVKSLFAKDQPPAVDDDDRLEVIAALLYIYDGLPTQSDKERLLPLVASCIKRYNP